MSLRNLTLLGSNLASVTDFKRIETPHSLCCDFWGDKTFTTRWSGGRVQVWVQVWAPASHLAISLKAVPEGNWRFRGQNQLPSSWGCSVALFALVGLASTNTGHFQVCCSRCWQWLACLRKRCYHSGDTDSVQESKRFECFVNIHNLISKICPKFQVLSSHFFEVTKLLYEHWAKIVQSKNISTPISNVITCQSKVCVQEFWYIASGLDIQL